jgi:tetratricopeptide (TPR) repeat protein
MAREGTMGALSKRRLPFRTAAGLLALAAAGFLAIAPANEPRRPGAPAAKAKAKAKVKAKIEAEDELDLEEKLKSADAAVRLQALRIRMADRHNSDFDQVWLLRDRGVAKLELGRLREAISDFDLATDIDAAACPGVLTLRGLALLMRGDFKEAAADFDAACAPGEPPSQGTAKPPDLASYQTRVWAHIARLRGAMGKAAGKAGEGILESYLDVRQHEDAQTGGRRYYHHRAQCVVVCQSGYRRRRRVDPVGRGAELAELFLGKRTAEDYYRCFESAIASVPKPVDPEDKEQTDEYKDKVQRLSALRALYIGEYYLLKDDRANAGKWLARAADFQGRPDAAWPLVGKGSIAQYELKCFRAERAKLEMTISGDL